MRAVSQHSRAGGALAQRVLFIDDDLEIRAMIRRLARRNGIGADVAGSGIEALGLARNRSYSAVFSDLDMPNLDGKTALEHLGRHLPQARLYVVTGAKPLPQITLRSGRRVIVMAKPWRTEELLGYMMRGPGDMCGPGDMRGPGDMCGPGDESNSPEPSGIAEKQRVLRFARVTRARSRG